MPALSSFPLTPVLPVSAVDSCVAALEQAILGGALPVGDRLPPERQLAEQLGVNRVTVRSALARLQACGLLSVRQGSGYRVHDFVAHGGPGLLPGVTRLARARGELERLVEDLLRLRRHIAAAVLEVLPLRASAEDLARVRATVDAFELLAESAQTGGTRAPSAIAYREADLAVVSELLRATHSPALALCLNPVRAALQEIPELPPLIYASPYGNVAGYRLMLEWLALPDGRRPAAAVLSQELERRDADTLARLRQALGASTRRGDDEQGPA